MIAGLGGDRSPEAQAAAAVFHDARDRLPAVLRACASGRELLARGREADLVHASALGVSTVVPVLRDGAFVDAGAGGAAVPPA